MDHHPWTTSLGDATRRRRVGSGRWGHSPMHLRPDGRAEPRAWSPVRVTQLRSMPRLHAGAVAWGSGHGSGTSRAEGNYMCVANRQTTKDAHRLGLELLDLVGGRGFVIDTSRNRLGPRPSRPAVLLLGQRHRSCACGGQRHGPAGFAHAGAARWGRSVAPRPGGLQASHPQGEDQPGHDCYPDHDRAGQEVAGRCCGGRERGDDAYQQDQRPCWCTVEQRPFAASSARQSPTIAPYRSLAKSIRTPSTAFHRLTLLHARPVRAGLSRWDGLWHGTFQRASPWRQRTGARTADEG